jgi:hypothetical protein
MAVAFDRPPARTRGIWIDLHDFRLARFLAHPVVVGAVKAISVCLFFLVLAAGIFGNQDPVRNIAPTFIWIVWWVGFAYVAALVGNFWPVINPWSLVMGGLERVSHWLGSRGQLSFERPYPTWLGVWPAIIIFVLFAWFELIAETAKSPANLAMSILIYSAFTWLGMATFGRKVWLAHGEAFSLAFGIFGRFAPIGARAEDGSSSLPRRWGLRPYASALIAKTPCRLSMTVFVIVMLSTVTFDGFKETPLWSDLLQSIALTPSFHPLIRLMHDLGFDFLVVIETVALALFPLVFLLVYLGFAGLTKWASGGVQPVTEIAGFFVFSLVPIAIAYHLAHYLSYLFVAGQLIIPLASDPFGVGWDLFGTAGYEIDIGVIGAKFVWYVAVIAIVVGHVFAVGVSHLIALRIFEPAKAAIRGQYPLLVLMVSYTMVSLWILSQPVVGRPGLGTLAAGSDTVSLAPFEFRELCIAMANHEEIQVDFHSGLPVEFDIHYHDGLTTRFPVKMSDITTHSGRFIAEGDRSYCLMWLNRNLTKTSLKYRVVGP